MRADGGWHWPAPADDPHGTMRRWLPAGECRFRVIPLTLGPESAERRFVAVARKGEADESAQIAVGHKARRVLFAHACAPCGPGGPPPWRASAT